MSDIIIKRTYGLSNTAGQLTAGVFVCKTLELPDKNNQQRISCIPAGDYEWVKVGPSMNIPYDHIWIKDVPGRSGICIHYGNYAGSKKSDVLGCILVGRTLADINGDKITDITDSRKTFAKLMSTLPDSGTITIS